MKSKTIFTGNRGCWHCCFHLHISMWENSWEIITVVGSPKLVRSAPFTWIFPASTALRLRHTTDTIKFSFGEVNDLLVIVFIRPAVPGDAFPHHHHVNTSSSCQSFRRRDVTVPNTPKDTTARWIFVCVWFFSLDFVLTVKALGAVVSGQVLFQRKRKKYYICWVRLSEIPRHNSCNRKRGNVCSFSSAPSTA